MHRRQFYDSTSILDNEAFRLSLVNVLRKGTELENRGGAREFQLFNEHVLNRVKFHTARFRDEDVVEYCYDGDRGVQVRKTAQFEVCWLHFMNVILSKRHRHVKPANNIARYASGLSCSVLCIPLVKHLYAC